MAVGPISVRYLSTLVASAVFVVGQITLLEANDDQTRSLEANCKICNDLAIGPNDEKALGELIMKKRAHIKESEALLKDPLCASDLERHQLALHTNLSHKNHLENLELQLSVMVLKRQISSSPSLLPLEIKRLEKELETKANLMINAAKARVMLDEQFLELLYVKRRLPQIEKAIQDKLKKFKNRKTRETLVVRDGGRFNSDPRNAGHTHA